MGPWHAISLPSQAGRVGSVCSCIREKPLTLPQPPQRALSEESKEDLTADQQNPLPPRGTKCSLAPGLDALSGATGLWEVRLAPGRGRGVFALADLPRGTPILAEDPLLSVALPAATAQGYDLAAMTRGLARAFARLGPAAQEEFLSCHGQRFEGDGDDEAGRLMVILRSNGYTLEDARGGGGGRRVALYPKVALINHSCEPNVLNADEGGTRKVVAARDIMAGEEVSRDGIALHAAMP